METDFIFLGNLTSAQRSLFLIGGFVLAWSLELVFGRSKNPKDKLVHSGINLIFWLSTLVINLVFAGSIVTIGFFSMERGFGILQIFELQGWIAVLVSILFLDFFAVYFTHFLEHKIPFLWRFHVVHHSDVSVDVSTALRHHPGEALLRAFTTALGAGILGAPIEILIFYQTLSGLFAQITHIDVRLPDRLERILSLVLITPGAHKIHHHFKRPYTDRNYGNIFSFWDRLFGTFSITELPRVVYGIDVLKNPFTRERNIARLMILPFSYENELENESSRFEKNGT
ncbi:sterol desaturase family protein [Leptospira gomenensis]|uniref:Sterol desaturase family protein n=1 Tax=Leptospira gomenensis TaxID=2484974 RepID=A0A5F1YAQ3_9LEPT|nr:sterol desaturase family protein [Leptospira gomenensis]TGK33773.1 sterol desaturase family protein [Leptospira gomenensis]TGK38696.1 sterol desaturase family protein [Leptospira gomenensis]TGK40583.1 sterol desaturase family protein [Leptospira gomenensis]TGK65333.1 sterol desaturase family protein [Leptospira gomenensis]